MVKTRVVELGSEGSESFYLKPARRRMFASLVGRRVASCGRLPLGLCRVRIGCESREEPEFKMVEAESFAVGSTCDFSASRTKLSGSCRSVFSTCAGVFTEYKLSGDPIRTSAKTVNNSISTRFVIGSRIKRSRVMFYDKYSCTTGVRGTMTMMTRPSARRVGRLGRMRAPNMRAVRRLRGFFGLSTSGFTGALMCITSKGAMTMMMEKSERMGRAGMKGTMNKIIRFRLTGRRMMGTMAGTRVKFTKPVKVGTSCMLVSGRMTGTEGLVVKTGGARCRVRGTGCKESFRKAMKSFEGMARRSGYAGYKDRFRVTEKMRIKRVFGLKAGCSRTVKYGFVSGSNGSGPMMVKYCKVNMREATTTVVRRRRSRGNVA